MKGVDPDHIPHSVVSDLVNTFLLRDKYSRRIQPYFL